MPDPIAWLPGTYPERPGPLGRYLPIVSRGIVTTWLRERVPLGEWILDPFGAAPEVALEAAQAGYRVLVAANNPIARFLLELAADPPDPHDMQLALAELSSAARADGHLEGHLRGLYRSECAQCGQPVFCDAFLWEREAAAPYAHLYMCDNCGERGEHPALEADAQRAAQLNKKGMQWARALERVAPINDPDRERAEEALEVYQPRAIYALMTLINQLDQMAPSPVSAISQPAWAIRQRSLAAMLLPVFDQANSLWPIGGGRSRPKSLVQPQRFYEKNVWFQLEESIKMWQDARQHVPVPVTTWPELPPASGGICQFEGRLKSLVEHLAPIQIRAIAAAIPRPNQAYWSLSALWAGWLWGREAAGPFKSVLRRRRYDWGWHTSALYSVFESLAEAAPAPTPFLGLVSEPEPGFMTACLLAASQAGYRLESQAIRVEESQAQILWSNQSKSSIQAPSVKGADEPGLILVDEKTALQAARRTLAERGEPTAYLLLHASALAALLGSPSSAPTSVEAISDQYSEVHNQLTQALTRSTQLQRMGPGDSSAEGARWWFAPARLPVDGGEILTPLSDRVEMAIVRTLLRQPGRSLEEFDREISADFPGLNTPELSLIRVCLESYGELEAGAASQWMLRSSDEPAARRSDLEEMQLLLGALGERLGYKITGGADRVVSGQYQLNWQRSDGAIDYLFYVLASAVLGKVASQPRDARRGAYIVVPGGRANLIDYKLRTNPLLSSLVQPNWRFIKFRLLRRVAEYKPASPEALERQLELDPLGNQDPQIQLL